MKQYKYKQILEAVNRGIQLALDDFEDIEDNSSISNDIIDTEDVIKNKKDIKDLTIDLGLPSGTLWCKNNLCRAKSKMKSNEYVRGDYFAWGELNPKKWYMWNNYKFSNISQNEIIKYNTSKWRKYTEDPDNLEQLLPEDDAATKILGSHYHIPTKEQWDELLRYTTKELVHKGGYFWQDNELHKFIEEGILITSAFNGNKIYLPGIGYKFTYDDERERYKGRMFESNIVDNRTCYYWTSTRYKNCVWGLAFSSSTNSINIQWRSMGLSIRPVYSKK